MQLESNIKGMSYLDVSNQAMDVLQLDNIEMDHTIFVMPDSVDFGDGAAWGESLGSISWFMSFVASYPIVQVSEILRTQLLVFDKGDMDLLSPIFHPQRFMK